MKKVFLLASLLALTASAADTFVYQNPITNGIDPKGLRDCQVFRDGAKWYMTGTAWPHWPRQETNGLNNPGVVLYGSDDLLNWKFLKVIVPAPGPDKWYHKRFWAPEVHKFDGKYYVTFNCSNPALGYPGQHIGYAVGDQLLGPYRVVTAEKPLATGNDLTLFRDDDGKIWAFWNRGREFGIGFAQIELATGKFLTEPVSAILPAKIDYAVDGAGNPVMEAAYDGRMQRKVAKFYEWDSIGIEGAYVVKRGDTYYLFYSSWTRGYEIGIATAKQITGPWTKSPQNPIYGAQSRNACAKNGLVYTGNPDCPFDQVGHNEVFTGPDGRLWLSCHGIKPGMNPFLVIDPIDFDADGNITIKGPTWTRQEIQLVR
jgi:xylan 1,4-beta-xylosidase